MINHKEWFCKIITPVTVECRYNSVEYIMILHSALQWQRNINQTLNSQKTPHATPSRASYGVSVVKIWVEIVRVITTPHCMTLNTDMFGGYKHGHCLITLFIILGLNAYLSAGCPTCNLYCYALIYWWWMDPFYVLSHEFLYMDEKTIMIHLHAMCLYNLRVCLSCPCFTAH